MEEKDGKLYGMEEYRFWKFVNNPWDQHMSKTYSNDYFLANTGKALEKKINTGIIYYNLSEETYSDHKELLQTAKKVYVHPACSISRTSIATKYKKCLDPWMADVVVMPDYNRDIYAYDNVALFINEDTNLIIWTICNEEEFESLQEDDFLEKLLKNDTLLRPSRFFANYYGSNSPITIKEGRESKLFYKGPLFQIHSRDKYLVDAIMGNIPNDKIVFEKTIMESLGAEETKLDVDNLMSIKEMLESTDENTASAALKSLSVMDYAHYPESVKYIIKEVGYGCLFRNKARHSTSVKFMLDYLCGSHAMYAIRRTCYSGVISEDDYKLFRQLVQRNEKCKDDAAVNMRIKYMSFMTIDSNGVFGPRLKVA